MYPSFQGSPHALPYPSGSQAPHAGGGPPFSPPSQLYPSSPHYAYAHPPPSSSHLQQQPPSSYASPYNSHSSPSLHPPAASYQQAYPPSGLPPRSSSAPPLQPPIQFPSTFPSQEAAPPSYPQQQPQYLPTPTSPAQAYPQPSYSLYPTTSQYPPSSAQPSSPGGLYGTVTPSSPQLSTSPSAPPAYSTVQTHQPAVQSSFSGIVSVSSSATSVPDSAPPTISQAPTSSSIAFGQGTEPAIALCSHHGRYLKIDGIGGVKADGKDPRQPSATWRMTLSGQYATFKASDGTYLSADSAGKVRLERKQQPGDAERFRAAFSPLRVQQSQTVVLTSASGKYLCAERSDKVIADRTKAKSFETWRIMPAPVAHSG